MEHFNELFNSLRLRERSDYVPDYEVATELAAGAAETVFEEYRSALERKLQHGDLLDATSELIIIVHGAVKAEINDPDNNLSEPPYDYFICEAGSIVLNNQPSLKNRDFTRQDFENSMDLIFRFNKTLYEGENIFLEALSEFLFLIINNKENARLAWKAIERLHSDLQQAPVLLERITSLLNDETLWLKSMESCFLKDYSTSEKLMDYYYLNDMQRFEEKAPLLAEHFKDWATGFLADKVEKGITLHTGLLKQGISSSGDYRYLKELKKYIGVD